MIKGSNQEDITIGNIYTPNVGAFASNLKANANSHKRGN